MAVKRPTSLRIAQGNVLTAGLDAGTRIVDPLSGTITVVDGWLQAAGSMDTSDGVNLVDTFMHKITDATTLAGTVPATEEDPSGYALAIELMGDHNTHTASTAYHQSATAAVTSTASTTGLTFIAQVNVARTALLAHYSDPVVHGGMIDATRYALVAATTVATTVATAVTLVNLLATYHAAHVAVTTGDSNVIVFWNDTGLADGALVRAGSTNATATKLVITTLDGAKGLRLVKEGADIGTTTAVEYCIKYVVNR
jgi:hypothetical protein